MKYPTEGATLSELDPLKRIRADLIEPMADTIEAPSEFAAVLNARGLYSTTQFVLRLSPRIHELVDALTSRKIDGYDPDELFSAYSTYLHETVHWWQHVGSHVRELHWIEPVTAARCLAHRPHLTFFDSAARHESLGRYSYLACDPFCTYLVAEGQASCSGKALEGDPWRALRTLLAKYPQENRPDLPPFQGGAAGFFAYDLNRTLERLPPPAISGQGLPQSMLHFYDVVIAYNHRDCRCWIISTGLPEHDPARHGERARRRADEFAALLARPRSLQNIPRHHAPSSNRSAARKLIKLALADEISLIGPRGILLTRRPAFVRGKIVSVQSRRNAASRHRSQTFRLNAPPECRGTGGRQPEYPTDTALALAAQRSRTMSEADG